LPLVTRTLGLGLNGGELAKAQKIANHESPRTTELYNRTEDEVTLDEIERIRI
jgi:integrase/recombinase XerD